MGKRVTFDQLIETEKKKIERKMILIENCLKQCTNIYRVCCNIETLTTNVDSRLKELHDKGANIANSFDGLTSLTLSIDGHILSL